MICGQVIVVLMIGATSLLAQPKTKTTRAKTVTVSVPFVGCPSDGQIGPEPAPKGKSLRFNLEPRIAQQLAYYAAGGSGVLAPRGWHCFRVYGSSGDRLVVYPRPVENDNILAEARKPIDGDVVVLDISSGGTSGRMEVSEVIGKVFPAYRKFAEDVFAMFWAPKDASPFLPYSGDELIYKSKSSVEYTTTADADGLGTRWPLAKNDKPVSGVAILLSEDTDLLRLAVRLPKNLRELAPVIVRQLELEAAMEAQPPPIPK